MPKQESRRDLRKVFLKNFVQQLIINSHSPDKEKIRKKAEEIHARNSELPNETPEPLQKSILHQPSPIHKKHNFRLPPLPARPHPPQSNTFEKKPAALLEQKPTPPTKPGEPINLGKITQFLLDPSVLSVECPGPKKNILVNRAGVIQTTPTTLTEEEISALMNEISNKTKIPIVSGLFKAAFQDLILTAVISEFVGTRFMLQKMNPF